MRNVRTPLRSCTCSSEVHLLQCYRLDSAGTPAGPILATFVLGASAAQHASGSPQPASLVIYPDGRQVVEHILTSVLVLERKRLTPTPTSVTPLFN